MIYSLHTAFYSLGIWWFYDVSVVFLAAVKYHNWKLLVFFTLSSLRALRNGVTQELYLSFQTFFNCFFLSSFDKTLWRLRNGYTWTTHTHRFQIIIFCPSETDDRWRRRGREKQIANQRCRFQAPTSIKHCETDKLQFSCLVSFQVLLNYQYKRFFAMKPAQFLLFSARFLGCVDISTKKFQHYNNNKERRKKRKTVKKCTFSYMVLDRSAVRWTLSLRRS